MSIIKYPVHRIHHAVFHHADAAGRALENAFQYLFCAQALVVPCLFGFCVHKGHHRCHVCFIKIRPHPPWARPYLALFASTNGYGVNNGKSLYTKLSYTGVIVKKLASNTGPARMVPDSPRGNMLLILTGPVLPYSTTCA